MVFKSGVDSPLRIDQGQGELHLGEQSNVVSMSYPLQLHPGLQWGDRTKTGAETEEILGGLREVDDREVR